MDINSQKAPRPPKGGEMRRLLVSSSADKFLYARLKEKAIDMRIKPTKAEEKLWECLQKDKLGMRFRRQHIINKFIVDFYCFQKILVIEIDGDVHNFQKIRDIERDNILKSLGYKILHFKNDEIKDNIEEVIKKIKRELI